MSRQETMRAVIAGNVAITALQGGSLVWLDVPLARGKKTNFDTGETLWVRERCFFDEPSGWYYAQRDSKDGSSVKSRITGKPMFPSWFGATRMPREAARLFVCVTAWDPQAMRVQVVMEHEKMMEAAE